ncbi:hypothetical protein BT96DRAFT_960902 [Gymnopus androsaceus JB14]|uniref:CxC1-like cysteine cluster associated with KDZ transposases domain-containing protein n=1 Tax=Gymnopus androsaceus JB14 TaxID=1447944 RepID=A0A6A4GGB5_9AGAR|nr:hypothetical protein BT96DRAFT_960902 [Gymnopus androsaceus JB14]
MPVVPLLRQTRSLRDEATINVEGQQCACCLRTRKLTLWVIRFSKIEQIELWASECSSASIQLIRSGLFPCSPVYPTLAVDIRVLDFVRRLFLRIAPNYTAWCSAATDFLASQGYHLPGDDPLRRRFANALQWFMSLSDMATARIDTTLQRDVVDEEVEEMETRKRPMLAHATSALPLRTSSMKRTDSDSSDEWDPSEEQVPLSRPSEYLRSRCPLCFGGKKCESIIVAADACFTQKHSAQKCGRDPPRTHPNTYFIPEEEVNAWKHYADCIRSRKQNQPPPPKRTKPDHTHDDEQDHCEEGLRVPKSPIMTLLCRHDRPLFTVNMNTPGEGQHYVLALLAKLFENLPHDTIVRFLYDIGCQLHRSCVKWGFLKPYMSRMTFAVSIFHAFGHQWPCQMIYHPRKCIGCGLSDGEGCERLWHSLSHLIAYGRYYVRMYNLDSQLNFNNEEGLSKLGVWLRRKVIACESKLNEAEEVLRKCGFPEDVLQREWDAQIKAQTKPLPQEALRLRKSRDAALDYEGKVKRKEDSLGVTAKQQLRHLIKSPFLTKKMNARALKTRIRERLRSRKFELDRLERSYRKQRSEQRINEHTQDSLTRKYNRLCDDMDTIIRQNKAPRNAIAPVKIEMEGLFDLDVDDDIWLDIGLGAPPLWLSNDDVRAGIRAMLDRDRCLEERKRLLDERSAMQEWFKRGMESSDHGNAGQ